MKNCSHPFFFSPKCVERQRKKAKKAASKQSWRTPWGDETPAGVVPVQWCDSLWCLLFGAGTFTGFSFCPGKGRAEIIITKGHPKSSLWDVNPSGMLVPSRRAAGPGAGWALGWLHSHLTGLQQLLQEPSTPQMPSHLNNQNPSSSKVSFLQAAPAPCPPPSDSSGGKADFWVQSDTRPA